MKNLAVALGIALMVTVLLVAVPVAAESPLGDARRILAAEVFGNFTLFDQPRPVPEVRFADGVGRPRALSEFRGKVVLLNLWATWCAPCRREMPTLDRLQAMLGGDDFQVLALAVDRGGIEKVSAFLEELGLRHLEAYVDPSTRAMRALGAFGLPTTLLIDEAGNEIGRLVGPAEWDSAEALALIRRAIGWLDDDQSEARARAAAKPHS